VKPAPILALEGVTLRLYERRIFERTNWRFLPGQHWAVIGGNGAGKSTLMKALCGHVPVVSGRILAPQDEMVYVTFGDQRAVLQRNSPYYQARWNAGVGEAKLRVAEYLSVEHLRRLNPFQVVKEPVDGRAFAEQRASAIELLGIESLLDKQLIQLSDGERRKISIARALMRRPRVLILDNPLTGLDVAFKERLTQIVERLMRAAPLSSPPASLFAPAVIVVTAREDEIPPGVTHVLHVEGCRVVAQGPRDRVLRGFAVRQHAEARYAADVDRRARLPVKDAHERNVCAPRLPANGSHERNGCAPLVEMSQVNVAYDGVRILEDVDWTVRRGEHWALLGANGAGKTTLLSLILGDHPQVYANDVRLFGRRRGSGESIWEIKRRIGWVAPELHLHYPHTVTALQVVCSGFYDSVGLYRQSTPEEQEMARAWMAHLGVAALRETAYGSLSEGQQRLVLLARALVKQPELLVLDEPCQGLDAANRARVRRTVDAVGRQRDTSLVYVTHNPDELPPVLTHLLRLERGRVVESRTVGGHRSATASSA
jgi:molybdate transport system ATP-binding protein